MLCKLVWLLPGLEQTKPSKATTLERPYSKTADLLNIQNYTSVISGAKILRQEVRKYPKFIVQQFAEFLKYTIKTQFR